MREAAQGFDRAAADDHGRSTDGPRREHRDGTGAQRIGREVVPVDTVSGDGDEKAAGAHRPRVELDAGHQRRA